MYKSLNSEDIVVGKFPIIEPAGADDGGALVLNEDYTTHAFNSAAASTTDARKKAGQLANIIGELPISSGNFSVFVRNGFKESIHPESFRAKNVGIDTGSLVYTNAGRKYSSNGSNWYLYPDVGIMVHAGAANAQFGCSEETVTVTNIFVRVNPGEFNYSTNPSFSDIDGNLRFAEFTDNPRTYVTTIGFYNDNGDCLAVAKVDKPTENRFEQALLFRVEMKF